MDMADAFTAETEHLNTIRMLRLWLRIRVIAVVALFQSLRFLPLDVHLKMRYVIAFSSFFDFSLLTVSYCQR
ncbi:hypothetical protein GGS20DRAFT_571690 [Poronia punctata]|nr:hypothetical protein GGS20DRAFT_571690 [Poronia punctata]